MPKKIMRDNFSSKPKTVEKKDPIKNVKSLKLLEDFTMYCINHPEERFWQALRSWSGNGFVFIAEDLEVDSKDLIDTFYSNKQNGK